MKLELKAYCFLHLCCSNRMSSDTAASLEQHKPYSDTEIATEDNR